MTDEHLPVPSDDAPEHAPFLDDVDTHIVEVTRHDRNDIVIGRQYLVLFLEDATGGKLMASNVSVPVTTEQQL